MKFYKNDTGLDLAIAMKEQLSKPLKFSKASYSQSADDSILLSEDTVVGDNYPPINKMTQELIKTYAMKYLDKGGDLRVDGKLGPDTAALKEEVRRNLSVKDASSRDSHKVPRRPNMLLSDDDMLVALHALRRSGFPERFDMLTLLGQSSSSDSQMASDMMGEREYKVTYKLSSGTMWSKYFSAKPSQAKEKAMELITEELDLSRVSGDGVSLSLVEDGHTKNTSSNLTPVEEISFKEILSKSHKKDEMHADDMVFDGDHLSGSAKEYSPINRTLQELLKQYGVKYLNTAHDLKVDGKLGPDTESLKEKVRWSLSTKEAGQRAAMNMPARTERLLSDDEVMILLSNLNRMGWPERPNLAEVLMQYKSSSFQNKASNIAKELIVASEKLDSLGFEKEAEVAIKMASNITKRLGKIAK